MIWFGWILWHINHCRFLNAKSSLYIYIKYTWFGLVGFYDISTIVGYLISNPHYTYIYDIYNFVWLSLWHFNHSRLFTAKSSLYIYIKYIWFNLVGFYSISTIVGYLMPNPLYTYILYIYDFVWLNSWHFKHCGLFNAKLFINIYIIYIAFLNTFHK